MTADIIKSLFPSSRNSVVSDSDRQTIVAMELQFEEVENVTVVKRNGEVMKNPTTLNPLSPSEAMELYFTERGWIEKVQPNKDLQTLSSFEKDWQAKNSGKNPLSPEFDNALRDHLKSNPDFDFYK